MNMHSAKAIPNSTSSLESGVIHILHCVSLFRAQCGDDWFDWFALSALCLFARRSTDSHRGIYGAQRLIHDQIMWVGPSWTELLSIFPAHLKEEWKLFIFHHCKMLASVEATNQPRKQTRKMSHKRLRCTSDIEAIWHSQRKKKTRFKIKIVAASWQGGGGREKEAGG